MPTDLTPAEREERESERLLNRKPAPSRKHRERRAPRHWQRRRRIREDDPDMRQSKDSLIDWSKPPSLRVDKPSPKTRSEERWEENTDEEIRDLDKLLRDLEAMGDDDDDDVSSDDFDAAIEALSDPDPDPRVEKRLEELAEKVSDGDDWLLQQLKDSAKGLESLKSVDDLLADVEPPPPAPVPKPRAKAKPKKKRERRKKLSPEETYFIPDSEVLDDEDETMDVSDDEIEEVPTEIPDSQVLDDDQSQGSRGASRRRDYATSYGGRPGMSQRTGAYHGVRDVRGNPTDPPNTGWKSTDRRYFTEKDYDVIVKSASKALKDNDWLAYGWEGGSEDAPLRAALDLAIQTVAGAVYQSKIDAETYDLLLNKLAKWGHETFSDTVYPAKAKSASDGSRSSSIMKQTQEYQNILRVASDLRQTDPAAALNIVKNLRALVSSEASQTESLSEHVAADVQASEAAPAVSAVAAAKPEVTLASTPVEVPFGVLLKLASSDPAAKAVLGSYLVAAKKKKDDDKKDDKTAKGKVPPQFLKNMKKPGKGKKKKASVENIAAEDAAW